MTDTETINVSVAYVPTKVAAKNAGLSQNYVSKLSKAGYADARVIRGIWYVNEASLAAYLLRHAEDRGKWQAYLSIERRAELTASTSPKTGAAAITVHPGALHKYHQARFAKRKRIQYGLASTAAILFLSVSISQYQFNELTSSQQFATVSDAVGAIKSSIDSFKSAIGLQPKVIYVGVMSPTIVNNLATSSEIVTNYSAPVTSRSVNEVEMSMNVFITDADYVKKTKQYIHKIRLSNKSDERDIAIFIDSADLSQSMQELRVFLTPRFDGRSYYSIDENDAAVIVNTANKGLVSIQLIAPRISSETERARHASTTKDRLEDLTAPKNTLLPRNSPSLH